VSRVRCGGHSFQDNISRLPRPCISSAWAAGKVFAGCCAIGTVGDERLHFASERSLYTALPVSFSPLFVQFFRPNRERRLLSLYPGTVGCGPEVDAGSPVLGAQLTASVRQGGAALEPAGDRFAVDWSGSLASMANITPDRIFRISYFLDFSLTPCNMSNKYSCGFRCGLDLRSI